MLRLNEAVSKSGAVNWRSAGSAIERPRDGTHTVRGVAESSDSRTTFSCFPWSFRNQQRRAAPERGATSSSSIGIAGSVIQFCERTIQFCERTTRSKRMRESEQARCEFTEARERADHGDLARESGRGGRGGRGEPVILKCEL